MAWFGSRDTSLGQLMSRSVALSLASILALAIGQLLAIETGAISESPVLPGAETGAEVPKEMKFVRVRLGKKTAEGAGHLGQPITSYFVNVDIGSPAKPFTMLLDLNARENFVPHYSILGIVCSRLNYRNGYSKKDSSSCEKEEAETLTINYNGCSLGGKAYTDQFELRDVLESYKPVQYKQRFLAMSSASSAQFAAHSVDGVLALNPWPISATGSELLTVRLGRAELMAELKFALHLVDPENDASNMGGEISLGTVNPTKFLGALRYHKVQAQHSWELALAGVMLGWKSIGSERTESTALLSTSSNGITGPASAVSEILELLNVENSRNGSANSQSRLYQVDCDQRRNGPRMSFLIEDALYSIPPTAYIKMRPASTFTRATCFLDIYSNYAENNKWELGTSFLSNFYSVFDINSRQVALGSLRIRED